MNMEKIAKKFKEIGARVKIFEGDSMGLLSRRKVDVGIDIQNDRKGQYFDIRLRNADDVKLKVLDTQKKDKHLLLMAETKKEKMKFLCGYDEREFFTCAIPLTNVSTVLQAKQALKPADLIEQETIGKIKTKDKHKRHRKTKKGKIHRQGEFNFIPLPSFQPPPGSLTIIHKNEPMSRGGKPHMAEYLYREGGTQVYVNSLYPEGLTEKEYQELLKKDKEAKNYRWESRVKNPDVYAKGKITHPDHKTLDLKDIWHRIVLNTEDKAPFANVVSFID